MLGNGALAQLALAEFPQGFVQVVVVDTHDGGFVKKRKKRKPRLFDNELDQLKYQIEEVIEAPEADIVAKEPIVEQQLTKIYPSLLTPTVDYANLAKADLLAKIKEDPSLGWTQEEREEEEELMLILDSLQ